MRFFKRLWRGGVAIGIVLACMTSNVAVASADDGTAPADAAVLTPLLGVLHFGAGSGLPLACSVTSGLVTSGADQFPGGGKAVSPLLTQMTTLCDLLSSQGKGSVEKAMAQSRALVLINPSANALIAAVAGGSEKVGTDDAALVSPFGPTIAGFGGVIAFFEGT